MGVDQARRGLAARALEATASAGFRVSIPLSSGKGAAPAVISGADSTAHQEGISLSVLGQTYGRDADSVLQLYREGGLAALRNLEGSFLLVLGDSGAGDTWLVTDHIGSRAAYVWDLGGTRLVTNSLADGPRDRMALDPAGVASYLAADGVRAGLTPYAGVRSPAPGSVTSLGRDSGSERYWRVPTDGVSGSEDELAEEMIRLMRRAVKKRIPASVSNVLLSLSGGVDSKGLLGLLVEAVGADSVEAFTYFHGEQVGDMDLPEARLAAATVGVRLRPLPGYQGDFVETLVDNALRGDSVAHFCDDADAWRSLSGHDDGRVLVAGDRQAHHLGRLPDDLPTEAMLRLVSFHSISGIGWFLSELPAEPARQLTDSWGEAYESVVAELGSIGSWRDAVHVAYLEYRTTPTLTLWRERFSSQAGSVVSPFLDRDLLEFVGGLPHRFNDVEGSFMHRIALTRAFPALFERGSAHGGWNIPDWGSEMARNRSALRALVSRVESPLEALVPRDVTLRLLDAVAARSPGLSTAASGWRWRVRRVVKSSGFLRKMVRDRKLSDKVAATPMVGRAALLRRLLTLHLALADAEAVRSALQEKEHND